MSTPAIEQIHRHSSIRAYKSTPVPDEHLQTIIGAAQRAATSSNLQLFSAVIVTDESKRKSLASMCGNQDHIIQAPVFIAWCADLSRLDRVCGNRGYVQETGYMENFLVASVDAAIAMQNATIAAESLGLGMCYIGGIRNDPQGVIDLLSLPELVFPISGMTLGWPDAEPVIRPRLPIEAIAHMETYDTSAEADAVRRYDESMVATGIYEGRQVPVPGKAEEVEDYGWSEHSARRVTSCSRTGLSAVLKNQGFQLR